MSGCAKCKSRLIGNDGHVIHVVGCESEDLKETIADKAFEEKDAYEIVGNILKVDAVKGDVWAWQTIADKIVAALLTQHEQGIMAGLAMEEQRKAGNTAGFEEWFRQTHVICCSECPKEKCRTKKKIRTDCRIQLSLHTTFIAGKEGGKQEIYKKMQEECGRPMGFGICPYFEAGEPCPESVNDCPLMTCRQK